MKEAIIVAVMVASLFAAVAVVADDPRILLGGLLGTGAGLASVWRSL